MRRYDTGDSLIWENRSLTFIGQECHKIPLFLVDSFGPKAKRLNLSCNCLHTLSGLDRFINLEELILDNNDLDDSVNFPYNNRLTTLSLNKNKLVNLEKLLNKLLISFPNLRFLSLLGNRACPDQLSNAEDDEKDYYRYKLFVLSKLPRLKFLDSSVLTKTEKREAARIGSYMKVIRPDDELFNEAQNDCDYLPYSPLPATDDQVIPKGAYGRLKYKYTGKHSEGNRFIRNSHL
ncbi:leucine-rich melanocyte differentiation-associated protein-like [Panonychus citri]|uniref:leucine-rich melanocyte differentiation-associated protein-like n=1 Tax=Panonychus citri TaxID=50023 RepID=UPI0023078FA2|nr:leucine-rich melanocyte differentiation-associated protein-like [Panonychus citri]